MDDERERKISDQRKKERKMDGRKKCILISS